MARTYNVIDADGHILEPVDIWEKYIDPAYRERAPKMIIDTDGKERLLVEGKVRFDEFANTWVLRANKVSELERLREKEARRIVLKLTAGDTRLLANLQAVLEPYRGGACHLAAQFHGKGARGTFSFGPEWKVRPAPALLEELEKLLGRGRIAVLYSPPPQVAETAIGDRSI